MKVRPWTNPNIKVLGGNPWKKWVRKCIPGGQRRKFGSMFTEARKRRYGAIINRENIIKFVEGLYLRGENIDETILAMENCLTCGNKKAFIDIFAKGLMLANSPHEIGNANKKFEKRVIMNAGRKKAR